MPYALMCEAFYFLVAVCFFTLLFLFIDFVKFHLAKFPRKRVASLLYQGFSFFQLNKMLSFTWVVALPLAACCFVG